MGTAQVKHLSHCREGEMVASGRNLIPSAELKAELECLATVVSRPKGTILFHRGDVVSGLYLILRGRVSLGLDAESPVFPTRILAPGCIAGLPATVSGNPYSLTAEVVQDAELAFVPRDAVLDCLRRSPRLCFEVMEMMSGEISHIRSAFKRTDGSRRMRA
jgi:CRP-like cAMP-binding protein